MADADSLVLFIRNTGALYPSLVASDRRLALKKVRGVYDRERAVSEFAFVVEEGAKRYVKELGESEELPSVWHVAFPKAVRDRAAREMVDYFETHYRNNPENFEKTLPKKYQGGKHVQTQLSEKDMRARRRHGYTLAELRRMPVISEGHGENLMVDTGLTRLWLSRMTRADGAKHDNNVVVETRPVKPGAGPLWKKLIEYQAKSGMRGASASAAKHERGRNPMTRHDLGNNESYSTGMSGPHVNQSIPYLAMTGVDSKWFMTRAGAVRWLAKRGYDENGKRLGSPSAKKHESGNNPRTKKHPLDAAAVRRISRAAAKTVPSRKRAPFTPAQRSKRGLAPLDAGLKARVDALVGRSKK